MDRSYCPLGGVLDLYRRSSTDFGGLLERVTTSQWSRPTPCTRWSIRELTNHMTRGNLNYAMLGLGGDQETFLASRDRDALALDPVDSFDSSWRECLRVFSADEVLDQLLDYPMGEVTGRQALAIRTVDSLIHTWDLARAMGEDVTLDPELVEWTLAHLQDIYGDLPEMPTDPTSTHQFFAAAVDGQDDGPQQRLLRLSGRDPR